MKGDAPFTHDKLSQRASDLSAICMIHRQRDEVLYPPWKIRSLAHSENGVDANEIEPVRQHPWLMIDPVLPDSKKHCFVKWHGPEGRPLSCFPPHIERWPQIVD